MVVWRINFSGWRKPEDLEELKPTFRFLKRARGGGRTRAAAAGGPGPGERRIASILLVDDEKDLCALLGNSLAARGFQVEVAHSKREALKCLERRRPDLVLLDLRLPDGDGMALLARLKKTAPMPAVFITTAFGSEEIRNQALQSGAKGFLDKPYHEDDVIRRIGEMRAGRAPAGGGRRTGI